MTTAVYVDIDPELKNQAESILDKIGMSYSQAVKLFTRQIIIRRAFPVELSLPVDMPLCLEDMTEEELDKYIQEGLDEVKAGSIVSAEDVQKELADICSYVTTELNNPSAAAKFSEKIISSALSLSSFPKRYRVRRKSHDGQEVRYLPVGNVMLIYTVDDEKHAANIIHVIHSKRNISSII